MENPYGASRSKVFTLIFVILNTVAQRQEKPPGDIVEIFVDGT
jgi:hypothetical protein